MVKEYNPNNQNNDSLKNGFDPNKFLEGEPPKKYKKKYKNHWGRAFLMLVCILGISVYLAFYALVSAKDLLGLEKPNQQIEVAIKDGMGINQIASLLSQKNVIEQPAIFNIYANIKGNKNKLKPGEYVLNSNMAYDQILSALRTGNATKTTVTVTFYEGMTVREIGKKLEENKVCGFNDFINALNTGNYDYDFISRIPESPLRFRKLEGYLFPDTYEFYVDMNPTSVVKKFLTNFDNKLTNEIDTKIKNSGMSLDEVITLASLIQEESSAQEEMGNVSSVFLNRLEDSQNFPKLQSDVTIFYVEKDIKPYLNKQNQEMYDAYNTYVCTGLPVAPIANPGLDAIMAVLEPSKTDYYFFLTDVDGKFYYAKTAKEHYNNNYTASQKGETHGISTKEK